MNFMVVGGLVCMSFGLQAMHDVATPVDNNSENYVQRFNDHQDALNYVKRMQQQSQAGVVAQPQVSKPVAVPVARPVQSHDTQQLDLQVAVPLDEKDIAPADLAVADVMPIAVAKPISVGQKKESEKITIIKSVDEIDNQSIGQVDDLLQAFVSSHNADVQQLVAMTQRLPVSKDFFREVQDIKQNSVEGINALVDIAQKYQQLKSTRDRLISSSQHAVQFQFDQFDQSVQDLLVELSGGFKSRSKIKTVGLQENLIEDYRFLMSQIRAQVKKDAALEHQITAKINSKIKGVKSGYKTSQELFAQLQIGDYNQFLDAYDKAMSGVNPSQALLNLLEDQCKVSLNSQQGQQKLQDLYETLTLIEAKKSRSNKSMFSLASSSVDASIPSLQANLLRLDPFLQSAHDVIMMQQYPAEAIVLRQLQFIYHVADQAAEQISQLQM